MQRIKVLVQMPRVPRMREEIAAIAAIAAVAVVLPPNYAINIWIPLVNLAAETLVTVTALEAA